MQVSKLTLAPYWFVPLSPFWEQSGLPCFGQRLLTLTTILFPALLRRLPELSVWMVSLQQVPQAGPFPVQVLRHGCREAWLGVEEAGRGIGVAIRAAESVSRTVLGEGCLVARAATAAAIRAARGRGDTWTLTLARRKALGIVLVLKLTSISTHAAFRAGPSLPATLRVGGILSKCADGSEERKEGVLCQHDDLLYQVEYIAKRVYGIII
ncbi:hypothetical protein KC349_g142 [Hortaea werneckii]|nr:hypothetical protein KC349_g142 [Hortaea werneckii]